MERTGERAICVAPDSNGWIADAVREAGASIVDPREASAVVWTDARDAGGLGQLLATHSHIKWVQVPFAGIENFVSIIDDSRTWTCGKGVYAEPVGEHVIGLALAGMRNIANYSHADRWTGPKGFNLLGARVTVVGGGGIAETLLRLLAPFDCRVTVVRKRVEHLEGAHEVVDIDHLVDALTGADLVVLALSLTRETEGLIGRSEFEVMESHAWIVNVARGKHIITDDLVWALSNNIIGGAALDVTDPEPLPDGHPLWSLPNCIITPHVGNTPEMAIPLLSDRVRENVRRYMNDQPLIGLVDAHLGY